MAILVVSFTACSKDVPEDVGEDVGADVPPLDVGEVRDGGADVDAEAAEDAADAPDADTRSDAEVGEDAEALDPCATPVLEGEILAADISTGLFIGRSGGGSDEPSEAFIVDSYEAYAQHIGLDEAAAPEGDDPLGWAIWLFFENGGELAKVYPTGGEVPSREELARWVLPAGLLVVPGLARLENERDRAAAYTRLEEFLEREEHEHVFFIGELPRSWSVAEIGAATPEVPLDFYGDRVALYHPWLRVAVDEPAFEVGPAGAVAGVIVRTDRSRGEWAAPAGLDAVLAGVEGLDQNLSNGEMAEYAEGMVNALRVLDEEPLVWGARTRENPSNEGRYVGVRRLKSLILASVRSGTHFAAWETYEESLWTTLAQRVEGFMDELFQAGAFQGVTASQSYFVRVDATTTSVADIARGVARVQIGFAPLRAAEFYIVHIEVPVGTCRE
ncbi:hypothetical protein EA187_19040 [Lujinxingia sediminis]|uniref:Phage tail sheath family protein n=1 Tax=Lujinxingia sediminis TaxID=2480984 RepID=A0ABY0CP27_9DELT|nr:hypothetical protein [Lujinxingia sediminis]RVU41440.1 hypothetical protein EA187_19040 [Lujinxingia sediminis]